MRLPLVKAEQRRSPDAQRAIRGLFRIGQELPAYVYILTNRPMGTLYTGVTTNLRGRLEQHRAQVRRAFSTRYNTHHLVYVEAHEDLAAAQEREWRLKRWRRAWKIALIESQNPEWADLAAKFGA